LHFSPFLLKHHLPFLHYALGSLIDGSFGVLGIQEKGMLVLHAMGTLIIHLIVNNFDLPIYQFILFL
jgi:hypothetical protein